MEKKPTEANAEEISESVVRTAAYYIWEREGCPYGRQLEHWNLAKAELASELRTGDSAIEKKGSVSHPAIRKVKPVVKSSVRSLRSKQVTA
jgi:hypothetical protein